MKNILPIFPLLLFILFGCTRNDAQRDFERQAYQQTEGYTETSNEGKIISTDEDDWRISPLFQGLIEVEPPYPNPISTFSSINFEVNVGFVQSISGLELVVRNVHDEFNSIYFYPESPLPTGLITFQISESELGTCPDEGCIVRVFLFDQNQQMISYGDIRRE